MTEATLPLAWVLGAALTLCGLWLTILIALVAQARAFGLMQARIEALLRVIVTLESRVDRLHGWVDRLRDERRPTGSDP